MGIPLPEYFEPGEITWDSTALFMLPGGVSLGEVGPGKSRGQQDWCSRSFQPGGFCGRVKRVDLGRLATALWSWGIQYSGFCP